MKTILLALILGVPFVAAADPSPPKTLTDVQANKLGEVDMQVIAHQHAVNAMEVDAGKLAQKSGRSAVKKYGAQLVKDHSFADSNLTAFALKHGVATIPDDTSMSAAAKKSDDDAMAKLKTLSGSDFDHEFLMMMVAGHEREVTKIEADIAVVENKDLAKLLGKVKPVLAQHLDQAKTLQRAAETSNAAR